MATIAKTGSGAGSKTTGPRGELYRSAGIAGLLAVGIVAAEVIAQRVFVSSALPVGLLVGAAGLYTTGRLADLKKDSDCRAAASSNNA